jgi:hypothetical protein
MLFTQTSSLESVTSYPPSVKLLSVINPGSDFASLQLNGLLKRVPSSLLSCVMKWQLRSPSGKMVVNSGAVLGASEL